jgi:hypothetical protein
MGSTLVNSWLTLIGSVCTIGSVWFAWWLTTSQRRERRVQDVASRYIQLRIGVQPAVASRGELKTFIAAGALGLSQKEMMQCAAELKKSGQGDPLNHPSLRDQTVIRRALDKNVDLDSWPDRTAFLLSEVVNFPDDPPNVT